MLVLYVKDIECRVLCWSLCSASSGGEARPLPRRKRSPADLGINYPGDLLVQGRQRMRGGKPPLIKRNTIADFANTKAYQASTASIISAVENGQ